MGAICDKCKQDKACSYGYYTAGIEIDHKTAFEAPYLKHMYKYRMVDSEKGRKWICTKCTLIRRIKFLLIGLVMIPAGYIIMELGDKITNEMIEFIVELIGLMTMIFSLAAFRSAFLDKQQLVRNKLALTCIKKNPQYTYFTS